MKNQDSRKIKIKKGRINWQNVRQLVAHQIRVAIKKYLKNMKYQLSLVYSKEDVRAIMDIIQEHVNIFLEQNPSASEEIIKQCICEIGNFVQVGIEDIDFHTLKIEELIGQKKKSIYYSYLPSLWNKCSKINPRPNF